MNDIAFLALTNGGYTLVDSDRFAGLNEQKWYAFRDGSVRQTTNSYIPNSGNKRHTFLLHRIVNGTPKGLEADHINHNRLDNRACNLRAATGAQNSWNQRKRGGEYTSSYKGVHYIVRKGRTPRWAAFLGSVTTKGRKFLGYFGSEKEAAIAYDNEARTRFGEYALTNFPSGETCPITPKLKRGRPFGAKKGRQMGRDY